MKRAEAKVKAIEDLTEYCENELNQIKHRLTEVLNRIQNHTH